MRASFAALVLAALVPSAFAESARPLTLAEALVAAERWARTSDTAEAAVGAIARHRYDLWPGLRLDLIPARDAARLNAMARFFDVLLADLHYTAMNERMAEAFVAFERLRRRGGAPTSAVQLGVELLQAETRYLEFLARRDEARARQRSARSMLALSMNRAADLPGELDESAPGTAASLPPLAHLETAMLQTNTRLAQARRSSPARAAAVEAELRQLLLEAWLEAQLAAGAQRQLALKRGELRDRVLERERTRFEVGEANGFGAALAESVQGRLEERSTELKVMLVLAYIEALVGRPLAGFAPG